jgi:tRNA pseudouridine38-40 synthase
VRIRLDVAYDGTDFHGWARQTSLRSVQGEIEAALERIVRRPVALTVAGRTDAGVHARGQVTSFDLSEAELERLLGRGGAPGAGGGAPGCDGSGAGAGGDGGADGGEVPAGGEALVGAGGVPRAALAALVRRLNAVLPQDVRVFEANNAGEAFDARFSALWREYCYRIADQENAKDPRERGFTWWTPPLDAAAMRQAGQALIGEHDFLPFSVRRPFASTVRTVLELRVERPSPGRIDLWVRADAFCHHMVRFIVGALAAVGRGQREPAWITQLLAAGVRDSAVQAAPPRGLTLERVAYPAGQAALAAQAAKARVYRG